MAVVADAVIASALTAANSTPPSFLIACVIDFLPFARVGSSISGKLPAFLFRPMPDVQVVAGT